MAIETITVTCALKIDAVSMNVRPKLSRYCQLKGILYENEADFGSGIEYLKFTGRDITLSQLKNYLTQRKILWTIQEMQGW